jgi:undecaprenyl-diphosphatase
MEMIYIVILAIIQGIAEFLPISSSAHLIIFRDLLGVGASVNGDVAIAFDVALHLGTLLAIIIYFFKDFIKLLFLGMTKGVKDTNGRIFWCLVLATIPAAVFGFLFEDIVVSAIRSNYILIACALIIVGILIYLVDKYNARDNSLQDITFKSALIIGIMQIFALVPGVSRSGITITGSRMLGFNREDSAKFAFYLSVPITLGAVLLTFFKSENITIINNNLSIFIMGILIAFISGLLCIEFLLKYLKKNDFKLFMWYRIALALFVIGFVIIK